MSRSFFFNPVDQQFAVAWLINAKSRDQLNIAMHLLGMVDTSTNGSRSISVASEAVAFDINRRRPGEIKAALVKAGLLTEIKIPGKPSTLQLGPAVESDRFELLLQEHRNQARAKDVRWPWAKARKSADLTPQKGHPLTPNEGSPHLTPQKGHPLTPNEGSPLRVLETPEKSSLKREAAQQPESEVNTPQSVEVDPVLEAFPFLNRVESLAGVEPCSKELRALLKSAFGNHEELMLRDQRFLVEGQRPVDQCVVLCHGSGNRYALPQNLLDPEQPFVRYFLGGGVERSKAPSSRSAANIKIRGIHDRPAVVDNNHLLTPKPSSLMPGDKVLLNDRHCVVTSYDWENERCTVVDLKTNESCCVDVDQVSHTPSLAIVDQAA